MSYNQNGKNKLKEWQNHQYDLGHYLGGQQHYSLDNPGKPAIIGKFIIIKSSFVIEDSSFINIESNMYESYLETTKLDVPLSINQDLQ